MQERPHRLTKEQQDAMDALRAGIQSNRTRYRKDHPMKKKQPKLNMAELAAMDNTVLKKPDGANLKFGQVWLARVDYQSYGRPHNNPHLTVVIIRGIDGEDGQPTFQDLEAESAQWFRAEWMASMELISLVHD